jgi:hypothetical protein
MLATVVERRLVTGERRIAFICGGIALFLAGVAMLFTLQVHDFRVTGLVRMEPLEPMARVAIATDPDWAFVPRGHYDGVYAYAIARDPWATGEEHRRIDLAAYRYGRPAHGWLAGALSLGSPAAIPYMLAVIGLFGTAGGAYFASRLAAQLGWSPWGGMVVAVNPGILFGVTADTNEPLAALVMAAGLWTWFTGRRWTSLILIAFLCLIKEPFIAVPAGLVVWELVGARRQRRRIDRRTLALLGATLLPLIAWWGYVRVAFGEWPFNQPRFVSWPLMGWTDSLLRAAKLGVDTPVERVQIGTASLPMLVAIGALLVLTAIRALRFKSPMDAIFLFFVAGASIFSWYQILMPKEMIRLLAFHLALIPAVHMARTYRPEAYDSEIESAEDRSRQMA